MLSARLRLPSLYRPAPGFGHVQSRWINMWVLCACATHLAVLSAGPTLSAGAPAPLAAALSWNYEKKSGDKNFCGFFYFTPVLYKMSNHKFFMNSTSDISMSITSWTYCHFSPQLCPPAPPLKHLSSRLPSDVALVMCPRRLVSSRPTSLLHCSILLSAPGLCPLVDSSRSLSLSLISSRNLWTSSGKEERSLWGREFLSLTSLVDTSE